MTDPSTVSVVEERAAEGQQERLADWHPRVKKVYHIPSVPDVLYMD
jgi:hypothetical protein